jgi:hypothetical protein
MFRTFRRAPKSDLDPESPRIVVGVPDVTTLTHPLLLNAVFIGPSERLRSFTFIRG